MQLNRKFRVMHFYQCLLFGDFYLRKWLLFFYTVFFKVEIRNGRFCSKNNFISIILFYQETNYSFWSTTYHEVSIFRFTKMKKKSTLREKVKIQILHQWDRNSPSKLTLGIVRKVVIVIEAVVCQLPSS